MKRKRTESSVPKDIMLDGLPYEENNTSFQHLLNMVRRLQESRENTFDIDSSYGAMLNPILITQLNTIYGLCNIKPEPNIKRYPTGIQHKRLFSIQQFLPNINYQGDWLPFIDFLRFISLPRLIPKEMVVKEIERGLDWSQYDAKKKTDFISTPWCKWWRKHSSVIEDLLYDNLPPLDEHDSFKDEPSAEEIYDTLYLIVSHNMELIKANPLTTNLVCWDGLWTEKYTYKEWIIPSQEKRGSITFSPTRQKAFKNAFLDYRQFENWRTFDLVLPKKLHYNDKHFNDYTSSYGLFASWIDIVYSQEPDFVNDVSCVKPTSPLGLDMESQGERAFFLAGLMSLFMPPLMFEQFEYEHFRKESPSKVYHGLDRAYKQSIFWFLMATIQRWFPKQITKDHFAYEDLHSPKPLPIQQNTIGYLGVLREDNTVQDIYPILTPPYDDHALAGYDDFCLAPPVLLKNNPINMNEYGRMDDTDRASLLTHIKAMGGFAWINMNGDFEMGLGGWPLKDEKPLVSYKHTLKPKLKSYDNMYNRGTIQSSLENPTVVLMDKNDIERAFVFTPLRPLKDFYGFINYSFGNL